MLKRNFGAALRGRSHHSRCRDLYLRVLTHNIALALLQVFYRALVKPLIEANGGSLNFQKSFYTSRRRLSRPSLHILNPQSKFV